MSTHLCSLTEQLTVRLYRPEDYDALTAIWKETRQKAFTEAQVHRLLRCEGQIIVAEWDSSEEGVQVVGVILWAHNGQNAYLYRLAVASAYRGKGIARALVSRAEQEIQDAGFDRVGLHVFEFNEAARSLYAGLEYENLTEVEYWAKSFLPDKDARGHKREVASC